MMSQGVLFLKMKPWTSGMYILWVLFYFSCQQDSETNITREILFEKTIHEKYPDIFTADSLLFFENETKAYELYKTILEKQNTNKTTASYILSRLLYLEKDSVAAKKIYDAIQSDTSKQHPLFILGLANYSVESKVNIPIKKGLKRIINESYPSYYKGQSSLLLGKYFDEVENEFDSAWHYIQVANTFFDETNYITPSQQECIENLSAFSTYRRKNLLAIRYANELFYFSKYWPQANTLDSARAYANRSFMMFREDDFEGTEEDIQSGLALIHPEKNPELYQSLMKSYLVIYTLTQKDSLWWKVYEKVEDNIQKADKDYIDLTRWKGQYLYFRGKYEEAIHVVTKAWQKEIKNGNIFSARYSTLCFMLSDMHLWKGDYAEALQFMYVNMGKFAKYHRDSMLTTLNTGNVYAFSAATKCAKIYYTSFKNTKESKYLYDAENFLKLVDQLIYKQMKVSDENALLQFYMETGQHYFDLGLHVHYHLFLLEKDPSHLHRFLEYSEKRKNSLLHRDMLLAKNEGHIPEKLVKKEFELRSKIKEEKQKGLRDNHQFNALMDEYISLEKNIEKNHSAHIEKDLLLDLENVNLLQKQTLKNEQALLAIDETKDVWYFTRIHKNKVKVYTRKFEQRWLDSILHVVDILSKSQDTPVHILSKNKMKTLFPEEILAKEVKELIIIPDGIYNRLPVEEMFDSGEYKVKSIPSLRVWKTLQKDNKQGTPKKVAVFAFSDMETIKNTKRTYLAELPGTYKEAQKIKKMYQDVVVYSGKNATRENFWKVYKDPEIEYIHLALHGKANSSEKDDVKLYFRTSQGGLDSLYGYELLRHRSRCQKVVLSACQSGLGKYIKGEGNYSLPRYFMLNGAKEVKSSFWDVEDRMVTGLITN